MLKSLKNNKKKGFTLVELIVVLVILAILAALLIPALTGYIDKAKQKQIIAETRQVVMAAQTLADEYYGAHNMGASDNVPFDKTNAVDDEIHFEDVAKLAEVDKDNIISITAEGGKIIEVEYKNNGLTCTYGVNTTSGNYEYNFEDDSPNP